MSARRPHVDQHGKPLTAKDFYKEGSESCRQYSQLTMQVRTLAQQVMIAYAVGLGVLIARSENLELLYLGPVLSGAGIILIVFGWVLCLLNLHHSHAFRAIRDHCLVPLELESKVRKGSAQDEFLIGPWQAHERERQVRWLGSDLAWYSPFIALWLIGGISLALGIRPVRETVLAYPVLAQLLCALLLGASLLVAFIFWLREKLLKRTLAALKGLQEIYLEAEIQLGDRKLREHMEENESKIEKYCGRVPKGIRVQIDNSRLSLKENDDLKVIQNLRTVIANEIRKHVDILQ